MIKDDSLKTLGLTYHAQPASAIFYWLQPGDLAMVIAHMESGELTRNVLLLCNGHIGWASESNVQARCTWRST